MTLLTQSFTYNNLRRVQKTRLLYSLADTEKAQSKNYNMNVMFIEPDMWSPNSPDLIPVDYAVCGALQHQRRRFTTINQLKQAIVIEWGKLSQRLIDRAIGQWRRRLECVVQQQDGHIEHLM